MTVHRNLTLESPLRKILQEVTKALRALPGHRIMATNNITTVSGVVEQVNDTGIKLQGGNWINFSMYGVRKPSDGGPAAPPVGAHITAQLKNDKFIHALTIDGTQTTTSPTPAPLAATPIAASVTVPSSTAPTPQPGQMTQLIALSVETRQTLLKTMAIAQPGMFADLAQIESLTEIVRNLEAFVLEDLNTKKDDDELTTDDLLDDDI